MANHIKILSSVVLVSMITISTAAASFESDYQSFVDQMIGSMPVWVSNYYNALEWSVSIAIDDKQGGQSVQADIQLQSISQPEADDFQVRMRIDGIYTDISQASYDILLDGEVIVTSPEQDQEQSDLYLMLHEFSTSIPMISDDSDLMTMINQSFGQRYHETDIANMSNEIGSASDIFGWLTIADKARLYSYLIERPLITVIDNTAINGVYDIRLHKRNIAILTSRMAGMMDDSLTVTDRNDINREMFGSMRGMWSRGTFDTTTNTVNLALGDGDMYAVLDVAPSTIDLVAHDSVGSYLDTSVIWDRDRIQLNHIMRDDDISARMNADIGQQQITASVIISNIDLSLTADMDLRRYRDKDSIVAPRDSMQLGSLSEY